MISVLTRGDHAAAGLAALTTLLLGSSVVSAGGTLTDNLRIDSASLGYTLQYRVYLPEGSADLDALPSIYLADGQWYLSEGAMVEVLDEEIARGAITPVVAIFVDGRNPDDLKENRRNSEFMCNARYASFFARELLPEISAHYPVAIEREKRVIAGLSFGGLNAACFGLMLTDAFAGIGMQSPASSEHVKLLKDLYTDSEPAALRMFLSVGTRNDNAGAVRRFHRVLQEKGYDVTYVEVPYGHSWSNWRPLQDDLLRTFFGTQP